MTRIYGHRLDSWLSAKRSKRSNLAAALGVGSAYLNHYLCGRAKSDALTARLRSMMGAAEWDYITGNVDTLTAPPAQVA